MFDNHSNYFIWVIDESFVWNWFRTEATTSGLLDPYNCLFYNEFVKFTYGFNTELSNS